MQLSKATLLAVLAALVQAQSISDLVAQIPSCAVSCLTTAIAASGCGLTDYVCQCTTGHNAILANGAGCISKACSTSDVLTTTNVTNEICSIATASGASTSATSAASTAASAVSSSASSTASVASSVSSAGSSAVTATATGTAAATASTTAASSASSAASKASSSAPATATTNAGSGFKVGAGMMGAAVIAAIAL